jgi:hypothetical protein
MHASRNTRHEWSARYENLQRYRYENPPATVVAHLQQSRPRRCASEEAGTWAPTVSTSIAVGSKASLPLPRWASKQVYFSSVVSNWIPFATPKPVRNSLRLELDPLRLKGLFDRGNRLSGHPGEGGDLSFEGERFKDDSVFV